MSIFKRIFGGPGTPDPAKLEEPVQAQVNNNLSEKSMFHHEDATQKESDMNPAQHRGPYIGVPVDLPKVGQPIDIIYSFINRDYFRIGYHDALAYGSKEYSETRQSIIRNELKTLFLQVGHAYNEKIGNIEERIEEAESNMLHTAANRLRKTLASFNEHVATIRQMEEWLDSDDPRMTRMLASYRLGYAKGFIVSCGDDIDMASRETYSVSASGEESANTDNFKWA